jgi:hypothetical protein
MVVHLDAQASTEVLSKVASVNPQGLPRQRHWGSLKMHKVKSLLLIRQRYHQTVRQGNLQVKLATAAGRLAESFENSRADPSIHPRRKTLILLELFGMGASVTMFPHDEAEHPEPVDQLSQPPIGGPTGVSGMPCSVTLLEFGHLVY